MEGEEVQEDLAEVESWAAVPSYQAAEAASQASHGVAWTEEGNWASPRCLEVEEGNWASPQCLLEAVVGNWACQRYQLEEAA